MVAEVTQSQEPFNDAEQDAIYRFLGYPNWRALAQSIQLGYPAASQPLFLVRDSLARIDPVSRARVRVDLCRCLALEDQVFTSSSRLRATQIGDLKLNPHEMSMLLTRLDFFAKRIADALGVVANPYSQMVYQGMGGGINAKVQG